MQKTKRLIREHLGLVDAVLVLLDARIPRSSQNPDIETLLGSKPRILLLNKSDMADEEITRRWLEYYREKGIPALATDCKSGKGCRAVLEKTRAILKDETEKWAAKGMVGRSIRIMAVGVPNVGKSALINRLSGSKRAKVEDRPGVTRAEQWIKLESDFELLDTPGVLAPKFEDESVGMALAWTGAIRDDILDIETLAMRFLGRLRLTEPGAIYARYSITPGEEESDLELMERIGRKRGFLVSGGEINYERTAAVILDEFRSGKLGRISLETPEER